MKNTAEHGKKTRMLLLALGALSVGCVILTAVCILLGGERQYVLPLALTASVIVNAIAVALSRMQEKEADRV